MGKNPLGITMLQAILSNRTLVVKFANGTLYRIDMRRAIGHNEALKDILLAGIFEHASHTPGSESIKWPGGDALEISGQQLMDFALEQRGRVAPSQLSGLQSQKKLSDRQLSQLLGVKPSVLRGYKCGTRRIPKRAIELVQSYH